MNHIQRLSEKSLAIFLFHGVIEKHVYKVRNYQRKHIDKDKFYKTIKEIRNNGYPLSFNALIDYHNKKITFPPNAFAISFDDGFENNYSIAAPILDDLKIPAIVYITSDFVDRNQMSWVDKLEYCFEYTKKGKINLPWIQEPLTFNNTEDKILILNCIRDQVKQNPSINHDELVSLTFSQCGIPLIEQTDNPLDLKMSWAQVSELSSNENFIIGGHSHTHKILSFLNKNELEEEIKTSLKLINENIGKKTIHYSYPEGLKNHYSNEVINVLKKYGIACCPSAEDGVNYVEDDLFHLKRIFVN